MKSWLITIVSTIVAGLVFISMTSMKYVHVHDQVFSNIDSTLDSNALVWGIDLSHHQQSVDWDQIECDKPHFIFFKATEGVTHVDRMYHRYRREAAERGIKVGSYHFFSYTTSGREQALHFLRTAHITKGDLPPVLDVEYKKKMASAEWIDRNVREWIQTIEDSIGVRPIVYCPCKMYNEHLEDVLCNDYLLWIAAYRATPPGCNWTFWQKTDCHKLEGIAGGVDYNEFNGDMRDFHKLLID